MNIDVDQAAEFARFGDSLHRARLARGLSLDDASRATRIRQFLLDALERGDLGIYPSSVFAAGHLRIYSRYLRIDPTPGVSILQPPTEMAPARLTPYRTSTAQRHGRRIGGTAVLAGVVVALSMYLLQQYAAFTSSQDVIVPRASDSRFLISTPIPTLTVASGVATRVSVATPTPNPPLVLPVATPTAIPTQAPTATLQPTNTPASGVKIDATMLGRVWVQVETDGRVSFSGILNAGDNRSWTATREIMVWAGDAANVSVTFNGKSIGRLGSPGQVLKVTWSATS